MIIFGLKGIIGSGKTSLANAFCDYRPANSFYIASSSIISRIADSLNESTKEIPKADNLDSINDWLKSLPSIVKAELNLDINQFDLIIRQSDIDRESDLYDKLFLYINHVNQDPSVLEHKINSDNKEVYRPLLQFIGAYLPVKVDHSIWFKKIAQELSKARELGYVIGIADGVRYPADTEEIQTIGGKIIEIVRPDIDQIDPNDRTEREAQNVKPDVVVVNNGSLEDLDHVAKQIIKDYLNQKLAKNYQATS